MKKIKRRSLQTGLDIGNSSIKLVQVSGNPDNLQLINFYIVKIEKDDYKKALVDIAKRFSLKEVNISVSGPAVIVRYIELPKMTDEELKSSMRFEAEKYIPFDIKDVVLDCQRLEYIGQGKMKVLLVAAKRDVILKRINMVQDAGLLVKIIDCDSFALTNAFLLNFPDIHDETLTALLDLGERLTVINILKGRVANFTRELQLGGWNFTKAVSEGLNMDMETASELKEDPKERLSEIMEIVKPVLTHMIEEIRLSLNYYENQVGSAVDGIYLSGGLSGFEGLSNIFSESLGIDCKLWDPLKSLNIEKDLSKENLEKLKTQLPVALGLAIRG